MFLIIISIIGICFSSFPDSCAIHNEICVCSESTAEQFPDACGSSKIFHSIEDAFQSLPRGINKPITVWLSGGTHYIENRGIQSRVDSVFVRSFPDEVATISDSRAPLLLEDGVQDNVCGRPFACQLKVTHSNWEFDGIVFEQRVLPVVLHLEGTINGFVVRNSIFDLKGSLTEDCRGAADFDSCSHIMTSYALKVADSSGSMTVEGNQFVHLDGRFSEIYHFFAVAFEKDDPSEEEGGINEGVYILENYFRLYGLLFEGTFMGASTSVDIGIYIDGNDVETYHRESPVIQTFGFTTISVTNNFLKYAYSIADRSEFITIRGMFERDDYVTYEAYIQHNLFVCSQNSAIVNIVGPAEVPELEFGYTPYAYYFINNLLSGCKDVPVHVSETATGESRHFPPCFPHAGKNCVVKYNFADSPTDFLLNTPESFNVDYNNQNHPLQFVAVGDASWEFYALTENIKGWARESGALDVPLDFRGAGRGKFEYGVVSAGPLEFIPFECDDDAMCVDDVDEPICDMEFFYCVECLDSTHCEMNLAGPNCYGGKCKCSPEKECLEGRYCFEEECYECLPDHTGCSGATPYCFEGFCVACLPDNTGCDDPGPAPYCKEGECACDGSVCSGWCLNGVCQNCIPPSVGCPEAFCFENSCVECISEADCPEVYASNCIDNICTCNIIDGACDTNLFCENSECVECRSGNDCPDPAAPNCVGGTCTCDVDVCTGGLFCEEFCDGDCEFYCVECRMGWNDCGSEFCVYKQYGVNECAECATSNDCLSVSAPDCDSSYTCTCNGGPSCGASTPYCESGSCFECTSHEECPTSPLSYCSTGQECVECTENTHCTRDGDDHSCSASNECYCETEGDGGCAAGESCCGGVCSACSTDSHCNTAPNLYCATSIPASPCVCAECYEDSHCENSQFTNVCQTGSLTCECLNNEAPCDSDDYCINGDCKECQNGDDSICHAKGLTNYICDGNNDCVICTDQDTSNCGDHEPNCSLSGTCTCDGSSSCTSGVEICFEQDCVECVGDPDCPNVCDTDTNTCKTCRPGDTQACGSASAPICLSDWASCGCEGDSECETYGNGLDHCELGINRCVECTEDSHCSHHSEKPYCIVAIGPNQYTCSCTAAGGICNTESDTSPTCQADGSGFGVCACEVGPGYCGGVGEEFCQTSTDTCVHCRDDDDCSGGYVCESYTNCVECIDSSDCSDPNPVCVNNECLECETDADCGESDTNEACVFDADYFTFKGWDPVPTCLECETDSHCSINFENDGPYCVLTGNDQYLCECELNSLLPCSEMDWSGVTYSKDVCHGVDHSSSVCVVCDEDPVCFTRFGRAAPNCDVSSGDPQGDWKCHCVGGVHCADPLPYCLDLVDDKRCVECLNHGDCESGDVCDTQSGRYECVACYDNSHCPGLLNPVCDAGDIDDCVCNTVSNLECSGDEVCRNGGASGECVFCLSDADCREGDPPYTAPFCNPQGICECEVGTDVGCSGLLPFCFQPGKTCIECEVDDTCPDNAPFCSGTNQCECYDDIICEVPAPYCVQEGSVVECWMCDPVTNEGCGGATPFCDSGDCKVCRVVGDDVHEGCESNDRAPFCINGMCACSVGEICEAPLLCSDGDCLECHSHDDGNYPHLGCAEPTPYCHLGQCQACDYPNIGCEGDDSAPNCIIGNCACSQGMMCSGVTPYCVDFECHECISPDDCTEEVGKPNCIAGECQCSADVVCTSPTRYCVDTTCVECRDTDDCPGGLYCSANGECEECTEDSHCSGEDNVAVCNAVFTCECGEGVVCSDPTPYCQSDSLLCVECLDETLHCGPEEICSMDGICKCGSTPTLPFYNQGEDLPCGECEIDCGEHGTLYVDDGICKCLCEEKWAGVECIFPCREGCENGYCDTPYTCTCHDNWYGEKCDSACECENGGVCLEGETNDLGGPFCDCPNYFYGYKCEISCEVEKDECEGVMGIHTGYDYARELCLCECPPERSGVDCSRVSDCSTLDFCNQQGTCIYDPMSDTDFCLCGDIYWGPACELLKKQCSEGYMYNPDTNECDPICAEGCNLDGGYCTVPGECECLYPDLFGGELCEPLCDPVCQKGQCVSPAFRCHCRGGFFGHECERNELDPTTRFGESSRRQFFNSPGSSWKSTKTESKRRGLSNEVFSQVSAVRSFCINEYWGILIDNEYRLMMWGEDIDNDYLSEDTDVLQEVVIAGFTPIKVECTRTSIYVLGEGAYDQEKQLWSMGRSEDYDIEGDSIRRTFQRDLQERIIFDVQCGMRQVYVILDEHIDGKVPILALGVNSFGSLGIGTDAEHSGDLGSTFYPIDSTEFPVHMGSGYDIVEYPELHPSLGYDYVIHPLVYPINDGVLIKFHKNILFYAGRGHPSTNTAWDNIPRRIDFRSGDAYYHSELRPNEYIDYMGRTEHGCLFIIASDGGKQKFYVSGYTGDGVLDWDHCNSFTGPTANEDYSFPFEITQQYGDYVKGEKVIDFVCGHSCYLITHDNVYMFGASQYPLGLDLTTCEDHNCREITLASKELNVHPGKGQVILVDKTYVFNFDMTVSSRDEIPNKYEDNEAYLYPPELVFSESGMVDNQLTVVLRKPVVQWQMDSEIKFVDPNSNAIVKDGTHSRCIYPRPSQSEWKAWTEDDYNYFKLSLPWDVHLNGLGEEVDDKGCGWLGPYETDEYDVYETRIHFTEHFYRGVLYGDWITKKEMFWWDLKVRFPKEVLNTNIAVEQDQFDTYWGAYIIDKTFDRKTRVGSVWFNTWTVNPNFLIFPENVQGEEAELGTMFEKTIENRIGSIFPNEPEYFVEELFFVSELTLEKTLISTNADDGNYICDARKCYQKFRLDFAVIRDSRVCVAPTTRIPVNWVQACDVLDHEDCVTPSREVTFNIILSIDNLCAGEMIEDITTDFKLTLYTDWTYDVIYDVSQHVFSIGDWLYFVAEVSCDEVSIINTEIEQIEFNGNDDQIVLYPNDEIFEVVLMVIDDLEKDDSIGFHFRLENSVLKLQPEEKEEYLIFVHLRVSYLGNANPVVSNTRRQNSGNVGTLYTSSQMAISIRSVVEKNKFEFVPYVVIVLAIVCIALSAVTAVFAIFTTMCVRKKNVKKKENLDTIV